MVFGLRLEALIGNFPVGRMHTERRQSWQRRAYPGHRSVREHSVFRNTGKLVGMKH